MEVCPILKSFGRAYAPMRLKLYPSTTHGMGGRQRQRGHAGSGMLRAAVLSTSVVLAHALLPAAQFAALGVHGRIAPAPTRHSGRAGAQVTQLRGSALASPGDRRERRMGGAASKRLSLLHQLQIPSFQYNTVTTAAEGQIRRVQSHIMPWPRRKGPCSDMPLASTTLLREAASGPVSAQEVLHGVRVAHGIRCRSRVAVGRGVSSRSRMAMLGQGVGTIGCTGALPALLNKLHHVTLSALKSPGRRVNMDLSMPYIERIKEEVSMSYTEGQRAMSLLGQLLTMTLTPGAHECRSTVRAELWGTGAGSGTSDKVQNKTCFSLSESVPFSRVRDVGSLELAQSQLRGLAVRQGDKDEWGCARVVDHELVFDALELNSNGVMRVITHANPSSELGQLIVDSLFGIDYEELGTEGPGVGEQTHMYEIRLLVETEEQAQRMHEQLRTLDFSDAHLGELGVLATQDTRRFELVAQEQADGVRTTTVVWRGTGMLLHVESLDAHLKASALTRMARLSSEAEHRQAMVQEIQNQTPIVRFSKDLVRWTLESDHTSPPPSCDQININLYDSEKDAPYRLSS